MPQLIYTHQRSKISKKQRAQREALLQEQRAIRRQRVTPASQGLSFINPSPIHRSTPDLPSIGNGIGVATKRAAPTYTGTSMIGIGQMHKSNAVPVFAAEQAHDLAKMRR